MGTNDKDIRKPFDKVKTAMEQKELPEHEKEKLLEAHKNSAPVVGTVAATGAAAAATAAYFAAKNAKAAAPKAEEAKAADIPPLDIEPAIDPKIGQKTARGFWGAVVAAALIIGALFFVTTHHRSSDESDAAKTAYSVPNPNASDLFVVKSDGATSSQAANAVQTAQKMQSQGMSALKSGEKAPVVVYLFNYDKSGVPDNKVLNDAAKRAKDSDASVAVVAYTDERGSDSYNMRLSQQRADAIAKYLVAHGVPANHVKAKGMGETHAFGNDQQCRRAVLTFN